MAYNALNLNVGELSHQTNEMYIYEDMVMCEVFPKHAVDSVRNFAFDKSDVLISTYPRSGKILSLMLFTLFIIIQKKDLYISEKNVLVLLLTMIILTLFCKCK